MCSNHCVRTGVLSEESVHEYLGLCPYVLSVCESDDGVFVWVSVGECGCVWVSVDECG